MVVSIISSITIIQIIIIISMSIMIMFTTSISSMLLMMMALLHRVFGERGSAPSGLHSTIFANPR